MRAAGNWADDQRRCRRCHAVKRPLPTCGRVPQCASRIRCLVTGDVGGGQEETGMKMTSVRKSAGRGRGETERERVWRGSQKEVKEEDRERERDTFPCEACDELRFVWVRFDARPDTLISRRDRPATERKLYSYKWMNIIFYFCVEQDIYINKLVNFTKPF